MPKVSMIAVFVAVAALSAPVGALAQGAAAGSPIGTPNAGSAGAGMTGVSGIPAGPGSVGGTNNSINDPSGIGNASKVTAPPPPKTSTTGR